MIKIERLVFNPFQENTYIIYDETGEAVLVDPGCHEEGEENILETFLMERNLTPVSQIYTHCHIDHVLGAAFVYQKYGLLPIMHRDSIPFLLRRKEQGKMYGIEVDEIVEPTEFIDEGDEIKFGSSVLRVLHTPGHVDGHVCFVDDKSRFVVVGDVLFRDSIGRTDLPTGNLDILSNNIRNKIYTLGDDFTVYPGHGPSTTVGYEIMNNPFVKGW